MRARCSSTGQAWVGGFSLSPASLIVSSFSEIVAFMAAVVLYLSVVVPGVKTIANPTQTETEAERIESLRVIGAANTMMIVCLAAVLLMQVSRRNHVEHPCASNSPDIMSLKGWTRVRTTLRAAGACQASGSRSAEGRIGEEGAVDYCCCTVARSGFLCDLRFGTLFLLLSPCVAPAWSLDFCSVQGRATGQRTEARHVNPNIPGNPNNRRLSTTTTTFHPLFRFRHLPHPLASIHAT